MMGSVLKYRTLFFVTFFLIGSFLANAQKGKKEDLRIYKFDKTGSIQIAKGYDVIETKSKAIIFEEAKWKAVKIEGGIIGLVEKGGKNTVSKNSGISDCPECKSCTKEEICVIREDSCICQKENDCNCKLNEICENGKCKSLKRDNISKVKKVIVF